MVDVRLDHAHALDDDVMYSILNLIHHGYSMGFLNMVQYGLITPLAPFVVSSAVVLDVVLRLLIDSIICQVHE